MKRQQKLADPPRMQPNSPVPEPPCDSTSITIDYHENEVPALAEREMERLYENLFSSVAMARAYGGLDDVSTYIARQGNRPLAVFLLRREKSRVVVLNEQVTLPHDEIVRFANYMFARFRSLAQIFFSAIDADTGALPYPQQRARFTNDIVLQLSPTPQDYLARLGKSTRQNIRYYLNRIKRDYPSFRHSVFENGAEGDLIFRDIVMLNRARMSEKDKVCGVDDTEAKRLLALARERGLVSVVTIDGQVAAGAICYRVGANFFLRVIAHDSRYNAYGLGLLCCYLAICECIARGGREFHFMWGREEYKYRLLGEQRDFDSIAIYRSRPHMLLDAPRLVRSASSERAARVKAWLLDPDNQQRTPARQARALHGWIRKLKKGRAGTH